MLRTTSLMLALCLPSLLSASEPIAPSDRINLLEGPLSKHFYTWLQDTKREDPKGVFKLEDGQLHISGDGLGGVTTHADYRDYHLVAEFRWGPRTWQGRTEKTRDSGILVHSFGEDGAHGGIWMRSIEAQVIQGGVGDFVVVSGGINNPAELAISAEVKQDRDGEWVWHAGGEKREFPRGRVNWYGRDPDWKDVKDFRGKDDVESPGEEWTRMDVICEGATITNVVNGTVVNKAFDVRPAAGKIQVQTELAEIYFRKLELWPIGKAPK